ncbi:MAG: FIG00388565: hypothetical protein [uncultured Sulfurovum sp.]|uniref:Uncharacterized protein n=1 Tax=uncultured Sulfurovum sp. TaxID=269237 RepID=A0A6S6TWV7_9BACT|nr:MAG: FIG00388565: hypothetical protein [uncultured Sulfurovum sp.]
MRHPFIWDKYSDQPYPLQDKKYKKQMRKKHMWAYVPLFITNIFLFPLSVLIMKFFKGQTIDKESFYGMGVDVDKGEVQKELVEELGIKYLLIRMPLWEMHRVEEYVNFAKSFGEDKQILLNILQDREHIEDKELLQKNIEIIFEKFGDFVSEYQVGNAINRTKWGFFSMDEYLAWYEVVQSIRDTKYPKLKLIGSSVIDFEYHYTIRTLFHFFNVKYDKFSSLLYVDRRGAPENVQMGIFDTTNKINMLYALTKLSPKTSSQIYITEVNWPLSNTAPYAPTSEVECVNEEDYEKFMDSYHTIALESGKIQRVYWHQLIAAGYGLVDDRGEMIRKTKAFESYKRMIKASN